MQLPTKLFVKVKRDTDTGGFVRNKLEPSEFISSLLYDERPEFIGEYQLVNIKKLKKTVKRIETIEEIK